MVVVTNRIPVAKGHEIDFEDRFKRRVHLVDRHPGFIRNEVHRPRLLRGEDVVAELRGLRRLDQQPRFRRGALEPPP